MTGRTLLLLVVIAATIRISYVLRMSETIQAVDGELLNVATSVERTGRFADPFGAGPTGPTAHVAPLPVLLVAGILRVTPTDRAATLVSRLTVTVTACLLVLVMMAVATNLGLSTREAILAGFAFAAYPVNPYGELNGAWEQPYAALALAATALLLSTPRPFDARRSWATGFGLGLAMLVTPVTALFAAGFLARRAFSGWRGWIRGRGRTLTALALAGCLVALAPWTLRNRVVLGDWVFVRDNLGLELGVSNSPSAAPTRRQNATNFRLYHPNVSESAAARVLRLGEIAYNDEMKAMAIGWMREHPLDFAKLTWTRVGLFWYPRSGGARSLVELATLVLALIGVGSVVRRGRPSEMSAPAPGPMGDSPPSLAPADALDLALGALAFSTVYSVIQFSPRYSYPVQWAVMILVGVGVAALAKRVGGRGSSDVGV